MEGLINSVENWAEERNLIKGSTPQKQFIKLMEEFGELCAGVSKNKRELIIDSIGDCAVVTIIMFKQFELPNVYLNKAYIDADYSTENNEMIILRISEKLGNIAQHLLFKIGTKMDFINEAYQVFYFLSKIALNINLNLENCLLAAYNEIKDRKGKMINGVFVKEEDLGMKND